MDDLKRLRGRLVEFRDQRDWEQFHTPRNLSMALASEVGELLAELRWVNDAEVVGNEQLTDALADEIADVGIFLILLADSLEIDLATAMDAKITRNFERFPLPANHDH